MEADLDQHLPAIRAGDPDAFGRWVAGAERPLRLSLHSLAARLDAEAVLQESLLRVWQVAPRVEPGLGADGRPNALLRLALRITRNLAIDELRRTRMEPTDLAGLERALAATSNTLGPTEPDPHLRRAIAECRAELPAQPSRALDERITSGGGGDDEALAARAGMRKNTFLQNVVRARRLIAECLRRRGVELSPALGLAHTAGAMP